MSRRCVRLPNGGYMCGSFTKADVEAMQDPNDQLTLAEVLDQTFDELADLNLAGGGS